MGEKGQNPKVSERRQYDDETPGVCDADMDCAVVFPVRRRRGGEEGLHAQRGATGFSGANLFHRSPSATLGGAFIFGVFMAFGWTACVGPILAGILILAATEEGLIKGAGLLFIYALGLGLPLMVISLMFKNMDRDGMFWRFLKGKGWQVNILGHTLLLHSTSMISGIIFISLGVLMVSGYLAYINLILPLETQVWFADIEDKLMEMFK